MGSPAQWVDKKSKAQFKAEKIDKGYEWYWREFQEGLPANKISDEEFNDALKHYALKEKERLELEERKREKSVVIKLPKKKSEDKRQYKFSTN